MKKKRTKTLTILIVIITLIVSLSVAYAVLSTTLTITGNAEIIASNWDIHLENILIDEGSITATATPTITDTNTINFSVKLDNPGDYYKFTVDVVNAGEIDAMIDSVVKSPNLTEEEAHYINYEIEYSDGTSISSKQLLSAKSTKTLSIKISYRSDISEEELPTTATHLSLSFKLIYVQADETAEDTTTSSPTSTVRLVSGDLTTPGSIVMIGDDSFNIISNDGSSVTLLLSYNITENIIFSTTSYWTDSVASYPVYVYNENSNLYSYVETYKTTIQSLGVIVEEARLITAEELENLGCITPSYTCPSDVSTWLNTTYFWAGTALDSHYLWSVDGDDSHFSDSTPYNYAYAGTRPVIKIALSEF